MDIVAKLEALLFYYGEPVSVATIMRLLHINEEECNELIGKYESILSSSSERGFALLHKGDTIQLATKPELKEIGEAIVKDEFRESLTPAALETLALVAYLGPVTRASIDYIRGVNSSYSMRNLSMRGLVERGEEKGMSFQYRVTQEFLKHMGLTHVTSLPEYNHYHTLLETFARTQSEEGVEEKPATPNETPFDSVEESSG